MCTAFGDALPSDDTDDNTTDSLRCLFNRLIFLQRDWKGDDNFGAQSDMDFTSMVSPNVCNKSLALQTFNFNFT